MPNNEIVEPHLRDRIGRIWAAAAARAADFELRNRAAAPGARMTPDQIDKAQGAIRSRSTSAPPF
jgi:hypothetical protein